MVVFVAKTLPVDNSNLSELDGFKPIFKPILAAIGIESKYENGILTVKVTDNDVLKYKIKKIEVAKKDANKLFKGDDWESNLFKKADKIKGSSDADMLYGYNGADVIHGNAGDDTIYGGRGKDFLDGGAGVNTLTGGGGEDTFGFSAELVGGNYSEITDFQAGKDKFQLAKSAFEGIGSKGGLKAGQFFLADDYAGQGKSVIYDKATGNLLYAKDAGGIVDDAQVFGRVANDPTLSHKDFLIA